MGAHMQVVSIEHHTFSPSAVLFISWSNHSGVVRAVLAGSVTIRYATNMKGRSAKRIAGCNLPKYGSLILYFGEYCSLVALSQAYTNAGLRVSIYARNVDIISISFTCGNVVGRARMVPHNTTHRKRIKLSLSVGVNENNLLNIIYSTIKTSSFSFRK
jgi:hypothetical protein